MIGYYNTTDLENIVKELETIKQSIVNCYMTVTDKSEEEIKSLMTNEGEWFTGEEAVEAGFCTAVMFTDVDTEVENAETAPCLQRLAVYLAVSVEKSAVL